MNYNIDIFRFFCKEISNIVYINNILKYYLTNNKK